MSEKWGGFSQEEINSITSQKQSIIKDASQNGYQMKKITLKQNKYVKKNIARERMLNNSNTNQFDSSLNQSSLSLPKEARLYNQQITEEKKLEGVSNNQENNLSSSIKPNESANNVMAPELSRNKINSELLPSLGEVSLEDFEKRQKMIKEQNRQRKELLKKALEDRTKRTHEEARRLGQIEEELKKLDIQLSNDVSILRNQIEVASLDFMEAQKRFDKAEREYLDTKLALFTKKERKELLTAHLCTIIEQNELRKAKKLSDLMDKLQLGSVIIEKPMERPLETTKETINEDINNPVQKIDPSPES